MEQLKNRKYLENEILHEVQSLWEQCLHITDHICYWNLNNKWNCQMSLQSTTQKNVEAKSIPNFPRYQVGCRDEAVAKALDLRENVNCGRKCAELKPKTQKESWKQ